VKLQVDHVLAVTLGGTDRPENLQTLCAECNAGKSSMPADAESVADVDEKAARWAAARTQAAAELRSDRDETFAEFYDAWPQYKRRLIPPGWEASIETWISRGLTLEDLIGFIPGATRSGISNAWAYFCGIAWRTLDQIEDRAAEIVDAPVDPRDPVRWAHIRAEWSELNELADPGGDLPAIDIDEVIAMFIQTTYIPRTDDALRGYIRRADQDHFLEIAFLEHLADGPLYPGWRDEILELAAWWEENCEGIEPTRSVLHGWIYRAAWERTRPEGVGRLKAI